MTTASTDSRLIIAVVVLSTLGGLRSAPAEACSCPPPDYEANIQNALAVFHGTVVSWSNPEEVCHDSGSPEDTAEIEFVVHEVWKGDVGDEFALKTDVTSSCAFGSYQVDEYIVIAREGVCGPTAQACSGSTDFVWAAEVGLLDLLDRFDERTNSFAPPIVDAGIVDPGQGSDLADGGPQEAGCSHLGSAVSGGRPDLWTAVVLVAFSWRRKPRR